MKKKIRVIVLIAIFSTLSQLKNQAKADPTSARYCVYSGSFIQYCSSGNYQVLGCFAAWWTTCGYNTEVNQ